MVGATSRHCGGTVWITPTCPPPWWPTSYAGHPQRPGALRSEHVDAVLDTARLLLASRTPDVRQDAYRLLVALVPARRAGHRTVINAETSERGIGALNAAINLLEAELHDSGTQPWSSAELAALESALERLAGSAEQESEAPTTEIAGRAPDMPSAALLPARCQGVRRGRRGTQARCDADAGRRARSAAHRTGRARRRWPRVAHQPEWVGRPCCANSASQTNRAAS